jgi:hypothetical protein
MVARMDSAYRQVASCQGFRYACLCAHVPAQLQQLVDHDRMSTTWCNNQDSSYIYMCVCVCMYVCMYMYVYI